jgi:hypothetical protein
LGSEGGVDDPGTAIVFTGIPIQPLAQNKPTIRRAFSAIGGCRWLHDLRGGVQETGRAICEKFIPATNLTWGIPQKRTAAPDVARLAPAPY